MSTADRREEIISRLATVVAGVPGIVKVYRNQLDLEEGNVPAIVILDADESISDEKVRPGRNGGPSPCIVDLRPQLFIVLGSAPADVGSALNALRLATIKAVMQDATLLSYCDAILGDRIRYEGCVTALASGRSMLGEMSLSFAFSYVLWPDQIV